MPRLRTRMQHFIDILLENGYNIFNPNIKPDIPDGWAKHAACKDADPDVFFPERDDGSYAVAAKIKEAKHICSTCPVESECLAVSLMKREKSGVWGGASWPERKSLIGSHNMWRMNERDDVHWPDRANSI